MTYTVMRVLEENDLKDIHYAEPFAGGAAIAFGLLFNEYASVIHLNDLSRPVYAFWHTALNETDWLCSKLDKVRVTMRVWKRQRAVYERREDADLAELGFATLFLNRCNRSGIIGGGVIGGKEQLGEWDMSARFNKKDILGRIRKIARYSSRIQLYQMDGREFVDTVVSSFASNSLTLIDPPYIDSGHGLYLNDYTLRHHERLANRVARLSQPWIVTYDRAAIGYGLYSRHRRVVYDLKYVASERYSGREVMFISKHLALPTLAELLGPKMHPVRNQCRLKLA